MSVKVKTWKFESAMLLNVHRTLNGSNGQHALFHAVVVENVCAIDSAHLVTKMIALDLQPKVKHVEMEIVPFLASGVSGVTAPRLVVVVELDLAVDFAQLAGQMIAWVIQMILRSVVKVPVRFTWNGLNGLIVLALVVAMDAALVIDSVHLVV